MLQIDIEKRIPLQNIKSHPWVLCRHPENEERVPIPPLRGDKWHTMTVLPYLMEYHYESNNGPTYYTERELNGETTKF